MKILYSSDNDQTSICNHVNDSHKHNVRKKLDTKEGMLPAHLYNQWKQTRTFQVDFRYVSWLGRSTQKSTGVLEISILSLSGWWVHGVYKYKKTRSIHIWFMHCTMCKLYIILRRKTICKWKILATEYHELASTGNYMHIFSNCISLCNALYSASISSCESH